MQNYLMLNGKKINLTETQLEEIKCSFGIGTVPLSTVKVGETFKIGEYEFILLEQSGDTSAAILKDLLYEENQFGDNNNYASSEADKLCNQFGDKIEGIVGNNNLVEYTVDLTADDGLKCYGSVQRKSSLLTAQQYRKYVYLLDEYKIDAYWWLATAYSTPKHEDETWVKCVSPRGGMYDDDYDGNGGVRPFLFFVSSISVSCEE